MGVILTKKPLCARSCSQLTLEPEMARILEEQHKNILAEGFSYSCNICLRTENFFKSKYLGVLCYDHSRVILPAEEGENDFIHANHVDGYNAKGRFICCQAPIQETVQDFYRMVFAFQVRVIVMLTKVVERGQERCVQYWSPKKGESLTYDRFTIKTKKINTYRHYVVTNLRITKDSGDFLDLKHFAYTDWPCYRLPRDPRDFLNFILLVRKTQLAAGFGENSRTFPPMVVHCSAGLNRTGTFCALDICISQYNEQLSAIICLETVVRNLRKQRSNCLSLPDHYVFCYQMMLLYIKSAATSKKT